MTETSNILTLRNEKNDKSSEIEQKELNNFLLYLLLVNKYQFA